MHAWGRGRWCLVAPAAGRTTLYRRGTHAGNTHTGAKHENTGKQSVYTVQLSALPSYIYTVGMSSRTVSRTGREYISSPRHDDQAEKQHTTNRSRHNVV